MDPRKLDLSFLAEEAEEEAAEIEVAAERSSSRKLDLSFLADEPKAPKPRRRKLQLESLAPRAQTGRTLDLAGIDDPEVTAEPNMGASPKTPDAEPIPEWKRLGYASQDVWEQTPQLGQGHRPPGQQSLAGWIPGSTRPGRVDARYDPDYDAEEIEAVAGERAARAVRSLMSGDPFVRGPLTEEPGEYEAALDDLDESLDRMELIEQGKIGEAAYMTKGGHGAVLEIKAKIEKWKDAHLIYGPPHVFSGRSAQGDPSATFSSPLMKDVPVGEFSASKIVY